jgi:uncharacterized protein (TIGR02117 family)
MAIKFSRIALLVLFVAVLQAAVRIAVAGEVYVVYVSSNGWHTGIVVATDDIPADMIPEAADFPGAVHLEFGWGDADFYPKPDAGPFAAIGAAFPGPAVMHVTALTARPSEFFADVEEIELELGMEEFTSLILYLHESFARDGERVEVTAPGLYSFSKFYPATGTFSLTNTCNTWTARGLELAEVNVQSSGVQRAEDVMTQLRRLNVE